jgi:hypothetical protein
MSMASMESCSDKGKEAAEMIAINIVLQNNAYALLDLFEYQKNEEAVSAIQTIYTASNVTCVYLMKEYDLTTEDVSNSLFELVQDMIKRMGSEEARRFSATIEIAFIEFKKAINIYFKNMEQDLKYFKELELQMGRKNTKHL